MNWFTDLFQRKSDFELISEQMSWLECAKLAKGQRVIFVEPWDVFPECVVQAGTVATVIEQGLNEAQPCLWLLPDSKEIRTALAAWNGEIWLHNRDLDPAANPEADQPTDADAEWHTMSPLALKGF